MEVGAYEEVETSYVSVRGNNSIVNFENEGLRMFLTEPEEPVKTPFNLPLRYFPHFEQILAKDKSLLCKCNVRRTYF